MSTGRSETARLVVAPPPVGQCAVAGSYPITISATGQTLGLLDQATVAILPAPPPVTDVLPDSGARIGSASVLFGWRSNTPGDSRIYVRALGETTYRTRPELRTMGEGQVTANFNRAVNVQVGEKEQTTGHRGEGWNKRAGFRGRAPEPGRLSVVAGKRYVGQRGKRRRGRG